jgi:hypothetical protein
LKVTYTGKDCDLLDRIRKKKQEGRGERDKTGIGGAQGSKRACGPFQSLYSRTEVEVVEGTEVLDDARERVGADGLPLLPAGLVVALLGQLAPVGAVLVPVDVRKAEGLDVDLL